MREGAGEWGGEGAREGVRGGRVGEWVSGGVGEGGGACGGEWGDAELIEAARSLQQVTSSVGQSLRRSVNPSVG